MNPPTPSDPNPSVAPEKPNANWDKEQQVPLGPACLMFFIIGALITSVSLVFMAYLLNGSQAAMAAKALEERLIPWVEQSPLDPTDKAPILDDLQHLVTDLKADRINERQLIRIRMRIVDTPVLQWGVVQQLLPRLEQSKLEDHEKTIGTKELDRLLRSAAEGQLPMETFEFILQPVAVKEKLTGRLLARQELTDADLRTFLSRAKQLNEIGRAHV